MILKILQKGGVRAPFWVHFQLKGKPVQHPPQRSPKLYFRGPEFHYGRVILSGFTS